MNLGWWLLAVGVLVIATIVVQVWIKGGVDHDKLEEVFAEDAMLVKDTGARVGGWFSRLREWVKERLHKG